jgi:hypothetical protein
MTTLLLPPRHTDDARLIWRAAIAEGWSTLRLPSWTVPNDLRTRDLAFYGEPLLAAHIAGSLKVCFVEPQLDWLTTVPFEYLLRKIQFSTLADARRLKERAFVKPADDKAFRPQVFANGAAIHANELYEPHLPVLISEPVNFELEYRFFVLEKSVQTFSLYCRSGEVVEYSESYTMDSDPFGPQVLRFAETIISDPRIYLPPAVVLDVGRLSSGDWAVIECNPAWGSGIYGCDPTLILPVLKRACVPEERTLLEDVRVFARRARVLHP